jgi:hypothetical protein
MYVIQFRASGSTEWRTAPQYGSYACESDAFERLGRVYPTPGFAVRVARATEAKNG